MTEQNPAIFLQAGSHPAEDVRRYIEAVGVNAGIVDGGDLVVTEKSGTPTMSVDIATGRCFVAGDENTYQGLYFCDNRGVTNLAVSASDPTNDRIDLVVAKVEDSDYSGATDAWSLAIVEGTPSGSPSAPSLPNNALQLASILVQNAVSTIVDADITDSRVLYHSGFLRQVFTASGSFTKATYPGLKAVHVTVQAGGGGGGGGAATGAGQASFGGGGGAGGRQTVTVAAADLATSETVTVGAAGAGNSGGTGGTGGTTSFGSLASAAGGVGGTVRAASATAFGILGGAGGAAATGDLGVPGGSGGAGWGNGQFSVAGDGATSMFGAGGVGRVNSASAQALGGNAATGYGGGGGGAAVSASAAAATGGAGTAGLVIVDIYF